VTFGAAFLFFGDSAFGVIDELSPGAFVAVFGDNPMASLDARQAGLHLRDTLLVLLPGPRAEPVLLFRKPLEAPTVAEQVLSTGTGGLHIDVCRVATTEDRGRPRGTFPHSDDAWGNGHLNYTESHTGGRWPTNLAIVHTPECTPGQSRIPGHKGYPNGPGGSSTQFSQKGTRTTRTGAWEGYADADGLETVNDWSCVPGCPRLALDALSGELRARGNVTPTKRRQSDGITGWGVGPDGGTDPGDAGGASRFFPQFADINGFYGWLEQLIVPPGAVLFRCRR
jgi:hypothetical protein